MSKIEKADISNHLEILEIFESARGLMHYLPDIHTKDETGMFINNLIEEGNLFTAKQNGRIIGFIEFKNGWINHLYIDPNFQSQGVGKELLDFAKKNNTQGLKLWVFEKNKRAISFYEREGFILLEKRDKNTAENEEKLPDRLYFWSAQKM